MRGLSTARTENDRVAGIEHRDRSQNGRITETDECFLLFFISLPHENGSEARVMGYIPHTGYPMPVYTASVSKIISARFTIVIRIKIPLVVHED